MRLKGSRTKEPSTTGVSAGVRPLEIPGGQPSSQRQSREGSKAGWANGDVDILGGVVIIIPQLGKALPESHREIFGRLDVRAGARSKPVVPMVQHVLGISVGDGGGLDAEVAEHGIGLPAAKEADGVGVNVGTEEGGGASWPEGTGGDLIGGDPGLMFDHLGGMAKGVGDVLSLDGVPAALGGM